MSRLCRYKESLQQFINKRSCIFDKNKIQNPNIESIIYNKIKDCDLFLPIMLLTIMNNQNKKNSKSIQGYYAATSMQILFVLIDVMENKDDYDKDLYKDLTEYLITSSSYSLYQNLETVKDNFSGDIASDILINSLKIFHDNVSNLNMLSRNNFEILNQSPCDDVKNWYIKDDESLTNHFDKLKVISKKSYKEYINKKIESLCQTTFQIGWLIGCGNQKEIKKIKKVATSFCYIYKLSIDFANLENDIRNTKNEVSTNFVVNFGLQNSYEIFMEHKHKFIEGAMTLNLFTSTIKEILNHIETSVDEVIEETSPDLKSTCSNCMSVETFNK
jgi:hypothetical protein